MSKNYEHQYISLSCQGILELAPIKTVNVTKIIEGEFPLERNLLLSIS
jgi:hypothetical protein